jgi:hypothetical protein
MRLLNASSLAKSDAYNKIPYTKEQGIIFEEQGIFSKEQGIRTAKS